MSRALETVKYTGLSGTQNGAVFGLNGGVYQVTAIATWGGGNVELFQLGADQSTWLSVTDPITENGGDTIYLPPGNFRWSITTATGVTLCVSRVPGE